MYNTADYDYPVEATPARWYEIYRALEPRKDDIYTELKAFIEWLKVHPGIYDMPLSVAAEAVEQLY